MEMRIILSEGRRLEFGINMRPLVEALDRAFQQWYVRAYKRVRPAFMLLHELGHCWLHSILLDWNWLFDRVPSVWNFFDWLVPYTDDEDSSRRHWSVNRIVFSADLRVRFHQLTERFKKLRGFFRKVVPRHQDRGSGDAVSHYDNLRRALAYSASAAVSAQFI